MKPIYPLILLLLLTATTTLANKLNVQYVGHEQSGDGYITLEINVSWENSWRDPVNWDAAWVFVKYRQEGSTQVFSHLYLTPDGHWAPSQAEITPGRVNEHSPWNAETNPVTGVFIQRRSDFVGGGHVNFQGVKLRADISQLDFANMDTYDIRVFGIEMVYVPEGPFHLGSGGSESGRFKDGSSNDPFLVNSEEEINISSSAGSLWGSSTSGDNAIGPTGTLPAAFPKGYNGFYVMKYQVSQEQYAAFLNSLAGDQAGFLQPGNFGDFRQGVNLLAGDYVTATPFVAQNYLTWQMGAAYLDWAGLRPMTELEFEKAARGLVDSSLNEFAWGDDVIVPANQIVYAGEPSETGTFVNEGEGGDQTYFEGYVVHAFTNVGSGEFVPPPGVHQVDVLVVGGGGGGGYVGTVGGGGGGGAGGLVFETNYSVIPGISISLSVGGGGTASNGWGQNSVFGSLTAEGGGSAGGSGTSHGDRDGQDGGSGGGASAQGTGIVGCHTGGSGIIGQGHDGGFSACGDGNGGERAGGGGGGAGGPGSNAARRIGGDGGVGLYFGDIYGDEFGENGWFAGGGAGSNSCSGNPTTQGTGGMGGGADGTCGHGLDGMHNTGGGGGGGAGTGSSPNPMGGDGGSGVVLIKYPITSEGSTTNAVYGNYEFVQGPLRVGAFAGSATSRSEAGATYWGIMEMSGNLWERVVSVGNTQGRAFTGLHGNGELVPMWGFATTENWPGWDSNSGYIDGMSGTAGFRGGSWFTVEDRLRTSDRHWAAKTEFPAPMDDAKDFGIRGVRTAPQE